MSTADSTVNTVMTSSSEEEKSRSLWGDAMVTLFRDKTAVIALAVVVFYAIVAILAATGLVAADWGAEIGGSYEAPSMKSFYHWFGLDIFGRSVILKVIHGTQVAMSVGLIASLISIPIGVSLGATAGYFGGWVDDLIVWFYTTVSSIPYILLLMSFSLILGKGLTSVYIALGLSSWVGICRLIRGEVIKHKNREYVQAASAIGGGHARKLLRHIIPNVTHIIIINASLMFQTAIKSEVILSFIGLGVQGQPSWGTMIDDAKLELMRGVWWQLAGATAAMFVVVLSFNILGDALRDALDPKLKGK